MVFIPSKIDDRAAYVYSACTSNKANVILPKESLNCVLLRQCSGMSASPTRPRDVLENFKYFSNFLLKFLRRFFRVLSPAALYDHQECIDIHMQMN